MKLLSKLSRSRAVSFFGLFTVAVASFFAMGYLFDKPGFYTWPHANGTPVALPTSVLFILLGGSVFILSTHATEVRFEREEERLKRIEDKLDALVCNRVDCPKRVTD